MVEDEKEVIQTKSGKVTDRDGSATVTLPSKFKFVLDFLNADFVVKKVVKGKTLWDTTLEIKIVKPTQKEDTKNEA